MSRFRDQAETLRRLMRLREPEANRASSRAPARVVTFSSGGCGAGKTCIAANLGALLARAGFRVLLVDADLGLANLDILFDVQPRATIEQVVLGQATLGEAIVSIEENLWLVPASSGLIDVRGREEDLRRKVLEALESFPVEIDFVLLDIGSGHSAPVLSLHHASYETVVVVTPEPSALTDAYSLIKLLRASARIERINVLVNRVTGGAEGRQVFKKLCDVSSRFLDVQLEFLGHVPRDEKVAESVMKRKILLDLGTGDSRNSKTAPFSGASACLELVSRRLAEKNPGLRPLTSSRFMDEPAQIAPGRGTVNTTRFFRTLLGEVKA